MGTFITVLLVVLLLAVAATLGFGVYTLSRGGEFSARWSNKAMRLRVALQAVAITVIIIGLIWKANHP